MGTWLDYDPPTLEMLNYFVWFGAENWYWADRDFADLEAGA